MYDDGGAAPGVGWLRVPNQLEWVPDRQASCPRVGGRCGQARGSHRGRRGERETPGPYTGSIKRWFQMAAGMDEHHPPGMALAPAGHGFGVGRDLG